jgi:hypothetical protein
MTDLRVRIGRVDLDVKMADGADITDDGTLCLRYEPHRRG